MATVKVKFRPSTIRQRPGCLVYFLTHNKIIRQISSGIKLYSHEWDEEKGRTTEADDKSRCEFLQSINKRVTNDIKAIETIIHRFHVGCNDFCADDIIREFRRMRGQTFLFIFMESIITRLKQLKQISTANNYRAALSSFRRFRDGADITFGAIDYILIEDYQAFLTSSGVVRNSVSFYMRIMRAVYNRAVKEGFTINRNPFHTVFTGIEKTRKRAISSYEIKKIRNLNLTLRPDLEFARDVFIFLFFCRGMSFIDAAFLRKTDVSNGILTYRRHKTGQKLYIKLIKQIYDLIEKYSTPETPYLLPIITAPGNNERQQYETALRRINKALKKIGTMAGVSIHLSTYVCRHSWATIAKAKNIPISVISDALGHESVVTTQIYLDSIDTTIIDRANELVIKDL